MSKTLILGIVWSWTDCYVLLNDNVEFVVPVNVCKGMLVCYCGISDFRWIQSGCEETWRKQTYGHEVYGAAGDADGGLKSLFLCVHSFKGRQQRRVDVQHLPCETTNTPSVLIFPSDTQYEQKRYDRFKDANQILFVLLKWKTEEVQKYSWCFYN